MKAIRDLWELVCLLALLPVVALAAARDERRNRQALEGDGWTFDGRGVS